MNLKACAVQTKQISYYPVRAADHVPVPGDPRPPNRSRPLGNWNFGSPGQISVLVIPEETVPFREEFQGIRVLVVNRASAKREFGIYDGLDMVMEAQDQDGTWRPIERAHGHSWCGTYGGSVFLGPNEYWDVAAPRYQGPLQTCLRLRLRYGDSMHDVYSNEFEGSISPGQFTRPDEEERKRR